MGALGRFTRLLATPAGVLVAVPAIVVAAGVTVMLLGRSATKHVSESLARRQLAAQAVDVQNEIAFALDQADVILARMKTLADPTLPISDFAPRYRDLQIARPGVVNLSIGFPNGLMRGTFVEAGDVRVQESTFGEPGTRRVDYRVNGMAVEVTGERTTDYDVRTRPHWQLAVTAGKRVWGTPRTFFTSHMTGITVAEPVYGANGELVAVLDVAFDVGALSAFISRPPVQNARTIVFAGDGTVLAFPGARVPEVARTENRLLRHEDYGDPAVEALFAAMTRAAPTEQQFMTLSAKDGEYLASVAPVGGARAGVAQPLVWYLATLVPERVLLGPTEALARKSLFASGGALAIALGVSLMFAWNIVRMRRSVSDARERARLAETRAKELGSYRLVAKLGTGGMGEVWRAEHRLLARQAAIKLVRPEALRDPLYAPKVRERFRREAQTLASMRSRHTIALYDYGATDDGTFYFVMELLDGLDLDRLVRETGPLPAARVIHLLAQACQSLAEAHEAGLMHRDIKPANLFVCRAADEVDIIKVLDFGIVHSVDDETADPIDIVSLPNPDAVGPTPSGRLTKHGAVVGTPGYIAPEQMYGASTDARSDIYALGCVAWWLLTAAEVFPRTDEETTLKMHANDPLASLRDRMMGRWIPQALIDLIESCLAKRPQDRPDDARSLGILLRAIQIPAEHAWTRAKAQAWWHKQRPQGQTAAAAEPTAIDLFVVPSHAPGAVSPAAASDAPTMAGFSVTPASAASSSAPTVVERPR